MIIWDMRTECSCCLPFWYRLNLTKTP
uniref:Uncharacterized protein n=1 Tax=Arundo donax TaxID=35708 RepID=A0A0A8XT63_ARUDO